MKKELSNKGMTLISVVVAAGILAVALAMSTSAFISGTRLTHSAADFTRASNFAEGVMERVRSEPFGRIESMDVTNGLPNLPGARCGVEVTSQAPNLKQITVTCSWNDGKRPRRVQFSTLVVKGGER